MRQGSALCRITLRRLSGGVGCAVNGAKTGGGGGVSDRTCSAMVRLTRASFQSGTGLGARSSRDTYSILQHILTRLAAHAHRRASATGFSREAFYPARYNV